ncbi:MAG: SAM-dependent methyltransferase, partial [Alloprevotella tannerae]|nr:SAM-dependent methyltransferase [Alloprevotella tannerae]
MNAKVPTWAAESRLRYPRRLSLEQCSGELAARYKAEVIRRHLPAGGRMVDLTGGFGVDFFYLGQLFDEAVYVEQQADLCQLAAYN